MSTPDFTHARWIKSSRSEQSGNCVELAAVNGIIGVRDSKLADASPILTFAPDRLRAFLDAVRDNAFGR
jgi:hypothetical protein